MKHLIVISCIFFVGVLLDFGECAGIPSAPLLQIPQGKLKGRVGETRGGRHFAEYLGIPYVSKPERFQLAGPAPKWDGVREAIKYGSKCLQYRREIKDIEGSEDCLFANVFTLRFPENGVVKSTTNLPVFVYIHGGSFLFYSGEVFSPKYLLDEDVILVTFNYRLGALGFLNTQERGIEANLGLKDQNQLLKWVHENIHHFGGDASRVVIFGNSAGSSSVNYHVFSAMSKNLFSAAISQSGASSCGWAYVSNPAKVALSLGEKLNCPRNTTRELTDCLKTKDAKEIIKQQHRLLGSLTADPPVPFAPSSEHEFVQTRSESAQVFLADSPENLLAQGKFNRVPYIIGVNDADGLTFAAATILNNSRLVEQIDKSWNEIAPAILSYSSTAQDAKDVSQKVREFYFGKDKITTEKPAQIQSFTNLLCDRNFFQCSQNTALEMARHGGSIYLYYFTHVNDASFLDHFGQTSAQELKGAKHQDEIQYFTNSPYFPEIKKDSKSFQFSQNIVKLWVSFASGKPTATWGAAKVWEPVSVENAQGQGPSLRSKDVKWYHIDSDTKLTTVPFSSRVEFWNSLPLDKQKRSSTPFVVGETRKSPVPPVAESSKVGKKPEAITIGHAGVVTNPPPIAGTTARSKTSPSSSGTSTATSAPTVSSASSATSGSTASSSTAQTESSSSTTESTSTSTTTTTTKKPGVLSKIFSGK